MKPSSAAARLPANAQWLHCSNQGAPAHFYHANGFPLRVYEPLLGRLSGSLALSGLACRATWPDIGPPPRRRDWQLYADDLIAFIEQEYQAPIIGIGHSLGATSTILAAAKRPELFKALVLIEPAMVSPALARLVRWLPKALMNRTDPARSTLRKADRWPDRQAFLQHYQNARGYKRFGPEALQALAEHGLVEGADGQVQLAFPKHWEAHNYTQPPNVMAQLQRLPMPCVAIRGKPSVFFSEQLWQEWQRRCPQTQFLEDLEHGHLLPLENPAGCHRLIEQGLHAIGVLPPR
ncbi:alpha/beta hydrolase [Pseudomonas benzenivorans]|uniref:Alpha/beta hydrolase n=1 Tax=Pseudomonas benzenivorans TaxID=556533 RepID=A0ABZ0PZ51_9PSED|nr:alpha/beta hydrolase [Pseudomonas benzenivorans]WPC05765.1 alpha/beta hydrolase [Pseudomonas benzenivorans]